MSVQMIEKRTSYKDYLSKKEAKGKWIPYWVVLDGMHLKFYETNRGEKLIGSVEIGSKTKCVISKRKTYSFPFMLCAAHGRHLLKCESAARRHLWMTAISQAVELLRFSTTTAQESDLRIGSGLENEGQDDVESNENDHEEILPLNVLLVASLPTTRDSPSLPFRFRNRERDLSEENIASQEETTSRKSPPVVYPFTRNPEQSTPGISDLERKQFSLLRLHNLSLDNDAFSPRVRSFPTTPENGTRPMSQLRPLTVDASYFGKSRSLGSLTSSRTDMRFSRHMVSGNDSGDVEM